MKKEEQSSAVKCFYLFSCVFTSSVLGDSLDAKGKMASSTHITAPQQCRLKVERRPQMGPVT